MPFESCEPPVQVDEAKRLVGKGWHKLLEVMYDYIGASPTPVQGNVPYVAEVKEKFGRLRIYVEDSNDFIDGIVVALEKCSAFICEDCGKPATIQGGPWIRATCEEHKGKVPDRYTVP